MTRPFPDVTPNTWSFLRDAMIKPTGFREYDARWKYPDEINLPGMTALGLGLGTQMQKRGIEPVIAVGNDYRDYSLAIKNALIIGLMQAGIRVKDIGPALSPMAYFSQFYLDVPAVAMVTASHNPNGWTGVKMGFDRPLTHGPDEMAELRDVVLEGRGEAKPGGAYEFVDGGREAYLDDLVGDFKMSRPLKVVCATGNGTAAHFAPMLFERLGVEVVPSHNELDYTFPNYNPNPEAMEMLHDMAASVKASGADLALGFDGDGDRIGAIDGQGRVIWGDQLLMIYAEDLLKERPNATIIADVKASRALFDHVAAQGGQPLMWKTGHSLIKSKMKETGSPLAGEMSGHVFFADTYYGFDDALYAGVRLLAASARLGKSVTELKSAIPPMLNTPEMRFQVDESRKFAAIAEVTDRLTSNPGPDVQEVNATDGVRVNTADGWWLLRASNTQDVLVARAESDSEAGLERLLKQIDEQLALSGLERGESVGH